MLAEYHKTLNQEEIHWKQKARVDWIQKGDRNTKFFKMSTLRRRSINIIAKTRNWSGVITYEEKEI